jgi:hypothetical protein
LGTGSVELIDRASRRVLIDQMAMKVSFGQLVGAKFIIAIDRNDKVEIIPDPKYYRQTRERFNKVDKKGPLFIAESVGGREILIFPSGEKYTPTDMLETNDQFRIQGQEVQGKDKLKGWIYRMSLAEYLRR